ncbi:MAG: hypothetical protein ACK6AD_00615 [Cyanobacteriota bacterium]|jgi:hypothetical protein
MFAQPSQASHEPVNLPGEHPADVTDVPPPAYESGNGSGCLIGIEDVQKALNRSRASVYRYTNTDPRNVNPPFNPRRLNPEFRSDIKQPLLFHANEVARFARDVLRIKEVTVEVLNTPSTVTQELLSRILAELIAIRQRLDAIDLRTDELQPRREQSKARPAA